MTIEQITAALRGELDPVKANLESLRKDVDGMKAEANKAGGTNNFRDIAGGAGNGADPAKSVATKASRIRKRIEIFSASDIHKGKGLGLGALVRAMGASVKSGGRESIHDILGKWGYEEYAEQVRSNSGDEVLKALGESTVSAGGALVPPEFSGELIELLRAMAVVRAAGPRVIPMTRGAINIPRQTGGGTAAYVGESSNATPSAQTTGIIALLAKKLIALTVISNELLADASPEADAMVRDDLAKIMALREDLAFLRGDGTSNTPRGMRYLAAAGNITAATQAGAAATLTEVNDDLEEMIGALEDNNVVLDDSCVFFMNPRSRRYLRTLRDGNGGFIFKDELNEGRVKGYKIALSTQIPANLGGSSNESEIIFAKMSEQLLGDTKTLELTFHPDATYDDSGTIRSGLSRDESSVRAIARHDFATRHDVSIAVKTTVKWGA